MASKKISELTAAGALTGAELVEAVQGGLNVKTTTQDIADLATPPGGGITSVNGDTGPSVTLVAGDIAFTPAGGISSADVQSALEELDADITAGLDGLKWKSPSARLKTTGNITLSGEQTIDGFLTSADDIVVGSQNTLSQNGIYTSAAGAWARRADADTGTELEGAVVGVLEGTANANTTWRQVTDNITLGVSDIVWEAFGTSVPDASDTQKGIVELATPAEVIVGTSAILAVTPQGYSQARVLGLAFSDELTPIVAATDKITFHFPYTTTILEVWVGLKTAQSSGNIFTVDIHKNGTTILSTKITLDNTEDTSLNPVTAAVISVPSVTKGDKITIDVDQVGNGTAVGGKIWFRG